jgi:hypothetical protein
MSYLYNILKISDSVRCIEHNISYLFYETSKFTLLREYSPIKEREE